MRTILCSLLLGTLVCLTGCENGDKEQLRTIEGLQEKVRILEDQLQKKETEFEQLNAEREKLREETEASLRDSHSSELQIKQQRIEELEAENQKLKNELKTPQQFQDDLAIALTNIKDVKNDEADILRRAFQGERMAFCLIITLLVIILGIITFLYYGIRRKVVGTIVENIQNKHRY